VLEKGARDFEPTSAGQPETDTTALDLTPVDRGEQDCAPVDGRDLPYVFGSMRSAKEHAGRLRAAVIEAGLVNKATWQGELEAFHGRARNGARVA